MMDGDNESSDESRLSWLWVIESLASCKEVKLSLLHDIIEMAPDDLEKNTREMVALRCLEDLYGISNGIRNDIQSVLDSKVELDLSESCEDALHRILHNISESDLRMAGPELLKWDIHSFIMQKRASMPKTGLQQLKDAILKGSDPCATLKEMSGLAFANECDRNTEDESDHNGLAWRLNGNNTDPQNMEPKENSIHLGIGNKNKLSQEESLEINPLLSKRDRTDLATENLMIPIRLNGGETLEDSSKRAVPVIEREGSDLSKERKGTSEEGWVSEDGHDEFIVPKRCRKSSDAGDDEFHQLNIPCNANGILQDEPSHEYHQNVSVNEVRDDNGYCAEPRTLSNASHDGIQHKISATESVGNYEHTIQLKASNAACSDQSPQKIIINEPKDGIDPFCEAEKSINNDSERIDVARKKHEFLSSQPTLSQDSLATADWTWQSICMKCNGGGPVLVCNTNGCPLVVHENCLGSSASFDNGGNFYCPFCSYSVAISGYLEAKKGASLARKNLAAFIHMGLEHWPKKFIGKLYEELNHSIQNGDGDENPRVKIQDDGHLGDREGNEVNHTGKHINEVNGDKFQSSIGKKEQMEPYDSRVNVNILHREEEAIAIIREKEGEEKTVQVCLSQRGSEGQQDQVLAENKCAGDNLPFENTETVLVNQRLAEVGIQQEVLEQQITNSPEEPVCVLNIDREDCSDDQNHKSIISNYSIRIRRQEKHYIYPATPLFRRKNVLWTTEEEEILKEGVQNFSNVDDKTIPWKRILEFGGHVFLHGRTPIDLKDKWRNICKGSPKSK